MTDADPPPADRPSPAGALQDRFRAILQRQMQDMPMLNPVLSVEALGLRPWSDHWLGILITPWFMNLLLMPRVAAKWHPIAERESRHYVFPAGVFEFIGARDPVLGDYQACSLFSPMFEFADQQGAHDTALAALDALFDGANREPGEVPARRTGLGDTTVVPAPAMAERVLSKRDFLFGLPPRVDRGP
ncbi:MAG TPA: [NiFe]-hydrogenase assembly chaperone HybE [Caldimonas sp.]